MKITEILFFILLFTMVIDARDLTVGYFTYTDTIAIMNDTVTMINEMTIRFENEQRCIYQQFPWKQIVHQNSFNELVGADSSAISFKYSGFYRIYADTIVLTLKLIESRNYKTNDKNITISVLKRGENELFDIEIGKIFRWTLK